MIQEKTQVLALPTSLEEVRGMAEAFVKSGMFSDTKQLAQAIVKIQAGRELGLPPVYSMQNINLIRDRLTTSANTMAMLVKKSNRYNYRIKNHTDIECIITFYEKDGEKWVEVGESTFTMDDAKRANLVKPDSGWAKFPRAMLFSRAISQGARMYAPDAIGGVYTDEEMRSIPPKPEEAEPVLRPVTTGGVSANPPTLETAVANPEPEPDLAQAEQDIKDYWPEDPLPKTTALATASQPEKVEEEKGFIDLEWLKESLKILRAKKPEAWAESHILSYMKISYKVEAKTVPEGIAKLDKSKSAHFVKVIQKSLDMV